MTPQEARSTATIWIGLPTLTVIAYQVFQALPFMVGTALGFWTVISLPIGVAIGQCVLSEK